MKNKHTFILLTLMFYVSISFGQKTVTGTVTNIKNKPVANALIYLDSINSGVKTDKKGYYKVELQDSVKTINVFSYKYGLLSSAITIEDVINFVFIDTKKSKKGNIKRGDNVGLVYSEEEQKYTPHKRSKVDTHKKEEDINSYRTIYDLIRGRVAGVTVTSNNRIRIRGVNSPNSSSEPLFIVDGTPVFSIDYILPVNVKDIKILKGSDTAIYGSRGANGVILITTKS